MPARAGRWSGIAAHGYGDERARELLGGEAVSAFVLYAAMAAVMVAAPLVLSSLLGQRHRERSTHERYESGVPSAGPSRGRVAPSFHLVAALFVLFDLEAVFLFGWALRARSLGWPGLVEATVFVAVLLLGLVYALRTTTLFATRRSPGRSPAEEGQR